MADCDRYVLDEDGNPRPEPDLLAWGRWFQTADRRIEHDVLGDVRISTVFLGLDHSWPRARRPVLFETMVFGGVHDQSCWRYSTRGAAISGHDQAVALVRDSLPKEAPRDG